MEQLIKKIRRYEFPYILSNMYILIEDNKAIIVDPIVSEEAFEYLEEAGVNDVTILLTHEHFDHTNGIVLFREKYNCVLRCHENAIVEKNQKLFNRPMIMALSLYSKGMDVEAQKLEDTFQPYTYEAEYVFEKNHTFYWCGHKLEMVCAPGHSPASCLIYLDDKICFTGDSLIPNNEPTLRWPGSDKTVFYETTNKMLLEMAEDMLIMPGHYEHVLKKDLMYNGKFFLTNTGG